MGIPRLLMFGRDNGRLGVGACIGDWWDIIRLFNVGHIEASSWHELTVRGQELLKLPGRRANNRLEGKPEMEVTGMLRSKRFMWGSKLTGKQSVSRDQHKPG